MVNTFLTPVPHSYSSETGTAGRLVASGKDWLTHGTRAKLGRPPAAQNGARAARHHGPGGAARRLHADRFAVRARSEEPKLSATDAIGAIAQWSAAYNKNPQDPKLVLGYAAALKNIGSRDKALEILTAGYHANQNNGEIAAELGRLALDMGRLDIAQQTLKVAEIQGVKDWKTLSAQGTLRAKQGRHAEAQQYYLAALEVQPDAVSVINNLALSYALDGKPNKSEELLRKAVASGTDDKRVRQNLALVLGLQGKFDEARKVASLDMSDQDAKSNMTYLRNMMSNPTQFAAASAGGADDARLRLAGDDWASPSTPPAARAPRRARAPPRRKTPRQKCKW